MTKEEIFRINELARKAKAEGLTEQEKSEQQSLRKKYIDGIRADLSATLQNVTVKEPDGTERKFEKKTLS